MPSVTDTAAAVSPVAKVISKLNPRGYGDDSADAFVVVAFARAEPQASLVRSCAPAVGQTRHVEETPRARASRGDLHRGFMRPRRHDGVFAKRRGRGADWFTWGGRCDRRWLRDSAPRWWACRSVGGWRRRPAHLRAHGSAGRALFRRCADLCSVEFGRRLCLCLRQLCLSGEYGWALAVSGRCRDRGELQVTTFHLPRWIGGRLPLRFGNLHLPLANLLTIGHAVPLVSQDPGPPHLGTRVRVHASAHRPR